MRYDTPTTSWNLVFEAAATQDENGGEALAEFCTQYWPPVYAFFRRSGFEIEAAQDLTQGFFARLIEKKYLQGADPKRGRFRSFLFACARNYGMNEIDRGQAAKRGGGTKQVSLELQGAEDLYAASPAAGLNPEQVFDRRWALTLIDRALGRLRDEHVGKRAPLYEALVPHLLEEDGKVAYRELGEQLGMSEGAMRVAAHRMRRRFGDLLREEIGLTVAGPAEVEEELRFLIASVS